MINVLLVTLQGSSNFGNRLQNYALQTVLEKMDCRVSNPRYDVWERKPKLKKRIKNAIRICLGAIRVPKYRQAYYSARRVRRFKQFDKKYIHGIFELSFANAFSMDWSSFDAAVTGSDQVWHKWHKAEKELEYFYLAFMPEDKRYSYAPSFGFERFEEDTISIHKNGLTGIRRLSCREQSGVDLIRELTGREATLLCDPTLLIEADEWRLIAQRPSYNVPEHYILEYHVASADGEICRKAKTFAMKKGLTVINVYNPGEWEHYCTSPAEFLWLVDHADYVLTNSFHGCVFSILFNTKFVVFGRGGEEKDTMFDRIRTLLRNFGLEQRIYDGSLDVADEVTDEAAIEVALAAQRKTAQAYLNECAKSWKK